MIIGGDYFELPQEKEARMLHYSRGFEAGKREALEQIRLAMAELKKAEPFPTYTATFTVPYKKHQLTK